MEPISILIADDHKLIRDTWSFILNNDQRFKVVAECSNGEEAIEQARNKRPQIVLMDINMTPVSGLEATKQIRKVSPGSRVIGVSMHSQPAYAKKMLQIGAKGYVTKNSSREEMFKAILEVHKGNRYICDEVKNILSEQIMDDGPSQGINALSERELQIVKLIKEGFSSKEISVQLNISLKTVEVHRHNILKKLNLKNSAALVNYINTYAVDLP
ncbi:MAG TPA: response regulator transcription factor [Chitinophagaceae bacterium]|nr:response regulator transcription factor [Chitinophagaceae bacterium]